MEVFTLVIWLMVGQRYKEVRMTGLSRAECRERLWSSERTARGECLGADDAMIKKPRKLTAHICGIAPPCLPVADGPGNAMLPEREP